MFPRSTFWLLLIAAGSQVCSAAEREPYAFNQTHTSVRVSWNHWGYSRQSLEFTKFDGELLLDFDEPETSKVKVNFHLLDGYWAGAPDDDRFERHLASADLFDVATFPTASFESTRITVRAEDRFAVEGLLTLKGKTLPVELSVTVNKRGESNGRARAGISASAVLDRSAWGLGFGAPEVPTDVRLEIESELVALP